MKRDALEIDALKKQILKEYENSQSFLEIGKTLGITKSVMEYHARKLGLKNHPKDKIEWVDETHIKCSKCHEIHDVKLFQIIRPKSAKPSRLSYCQPCRGKQTSKNVTSTLKNYFTSSLRRMRKKNVVNGIGFDVSAEFLIELYEEQEGKCFYTDIFMEIPSYGEKNGRNAHGPSIDKIIPELGYVEGNLVLCTVRSNLMKSNCTLEEMREYLPDWYSRIILKFPLLKI